MSVAPGKRLEPAHPAPVKPLEMPLAASIKTHMLKLFHRSKSTRQPRDMVIPNKRTEHVATRPPVASMVDPYPMAMGVVSNGAVARSSLPVPERRAGSVRKKEVPARQNRVSPHSFSSKLKVTKKII